MEEGIVGEILIFFNNSRVYLCYAHNRSWTL